MFGKIKMSTNQYCENIAKAFQDGYKLGRKLETKNTPGDILQPVCKQIFSVKDLPKIDKLPISECIETTIEVPLNVSLEEAKKDLLHSLIINIERYVTFDGNIDPLKNNKTLTAKINIVKEAK